jgi:hypothetical protein
MRVSPDARAAGGGHAGAVLDALVLLVRTQLRRRWGSYLAIAVVVGASGAVAMAAIAGARRTASAFERQLEAGHASQLSINVGNLDAETQQRLAALPGVEGVQSYAGVLVAAIDPATGEPLISFTDMESLVSVDGRFLDQDRAVVDEGRLPRADRADEVLIDRSAHRASGLGAGDHVTLLVVSPETYEPLRQVEATITGVGITADDVAIDDVDDLDRMFFTPAFLAANPDVVDDGQDPEAFTYWWSGLRLAPGTDVAAVEAAWTASEQAADPGRDVRFRRISTLHATVQRAIRPQVVALATFGGFAAALALGLTVQVSWRAIRAGRYDAAVLRTLGAAPRTSTAGPAIATVAAVVLGAVLAVGGAIALSPFAPIGAVADIDPHPGVSVDLVALLPGFALLLLCGVVTALGAGVRVTRPQPRPAASRRRIQGPVPLVLGVRAAIGRGSTAGRSAVTAAVVATIAVVGALAYTTDLRHLTRTPRLFGADFDAALQIGAGYDDFDRDEMAQFLDEHATDLVRDWATLTYAGVQVGDVLVPAVGLDPGRGSVAPTIVDGRAPAGPDEIALGADTLDRVGARVGDRIDVVGGHQLAVVGTAILPALGQATGDHPTLRSGGWMTGDGLRALLPSDRPPPGGSAVLVDRAPGATVGDLQTLADQMEADGQAWGYNGDDADGAVQVMAPPRPGELVGISPTVTAPAVMAAVLALGAMVALGVALVTSVRARRRDLSVMKALGFTRRQLAAMVQAQALTTVLIGAVVGVPLGVALGSTVWRRFADDVGVLSETRVPVGVIALAFVVGLVAAMAFTALPGRAAARTPAALILRSE